MKRKFLNIIKIDEPILQTIVYCFIHHNKKALPHYMLKKSRFEQYINSVILNAENRYVYDDLEYIYLKKIEPIIAKNGNYKIILSEKTYQDILLFVREQTLFHAIQNEFIFHGSEDSIIKSIFCIGYSTFQSAFDIVPKLNIQMSEENKNQATINRQAFRATKKGKICPKIFTYIKKHIEFHYNNIDQEQCFHEHMDNQLYFPSMDLETHVRKLNYKYQCSLSYCTEFYNLSLYEFPRCKITFSEGTQFDFSLLDKPREDAYLHEYVNNPYDYVATVFENNILSKMETFFINHQKKRLLHSVNEKQEVPSINKQKRI